MKNPTWHWAITDDGDFAFEIEAQGTVVLEFTLSREKVLATLVQELQAADSEDRVEDLEEWDTLAKGLLQLQVKITDELNEFRRGRI